MRFTVSLFFVALLMASCSSKKAQKVLTMTTIKVVFLPSFLFASEIEIFEGNNPSATLKVTKRNEYDSIETVHNKTFNITNEELSALMQGVESFNQGYSGPQPGSGLDGIAVFVISDRLKANDTIECWSPRREGTDTIYYKLIDPIFKTMRKYMTTDAEMMYVERLEQYFEYGVPIKKIGDKQYRIYGALSYFEQVTRAINALIEEIPADESVLVDMSNFEGMGTFYYPHFKKLLAKNSRVKWIVNDEARRQLMEIGWPETSMEQTNKKGFGEF